MREYRSLWPVLISLSVVAVALLALSPGLISRGRAQPLGDPPTHQAALPATTGRSEPVLVTLLADADLDLDGLATAWRATTVPIGAARTVAALVPADRLAKLAAHPDVLAILPAGRNPSPSGHEDPPPTFAPAEDVYTPQLWYSRQAFGVDRAHANGFDGRGVIVGIEDTGVDFGHPDLHDTFARATDPESPFHGFPLVYDDVSATAYVVRGGDPSGTNYADSTASFTPTVGLGGEGSAVLTLPASRIDMVDGQERSVQTTVTRTVRYVNNSLSGRIHYGVHPDSTLERTEVTDGVTHTVGAVFLVSDTAEAGHYDSVTVDLGTQGMSRALTATYDFRGLRPARLGPDADPTVVKDLNGDGVADLSGGIVYFVADGQHHVPILDWLWDAHGTSDPRNRITPPAPGSLVAFFGDFGGSFHGTAVATQIAGQGVVSSRFGVGAAVPPGTGGTDGDTVLGGVNQGLAPGAKLFATRELGVPNQWLAMTRGYDGLPNTGDDAQVINNSWGDEDVSSLQVPYDAFATALNAPDDSPRTLFVVSTGNGGQGQSTISNVASGSTVLAVGGGTQFGTDDFIEIVSDTLQLSTGDPSSFTSRGPDLRGRPGVGVMAVGSSASGGWPPNITRDNRGLYNGNHAWRWFGGTSQAGPQAAAVAALVFQARMAQSGEFPTWAEARALMQSGADDTDHGPTVQGAGHVNADQSTAIAAGLFGAGVEPSEWAAGDYRGTSYLGFPNVAARGATYARAFTATNRSSLPITLTLSSDRLEAISRQAFTVEASSAEENDYGYKRVDYLLTPDQLEIPADTDAMRVRLTHDFGRFCTEDPAGPHTGCGTRGESAWYLRAYAWHDWNGNGRAWSDTNGNGVVNDGELDLPATPTNGTEPDPRTSLELSALSESYLSANTQEIRVRQPIERAGDGLHLALVHRVRSENVPTDTLRLEVTYFRHAAWPPLALDQSELTLAAGESGAFRAQLAVPADAPYGFHEGAIRITSNGGNPDAGVRVLHAVPGMGDVDVYVDDERRVTGLGYGKISDAPYLDVAPGFHRFRVTPTGAPLGAAAIDQNVHVRTGTEYTLAAVPASDGATLQTIVDGNTAPEAGYTHLRFGHLSHDTGPFDVFLNSTPLLTGAVYRDVSAPVTVPNGTYLLTVVPTAAITPGLAIQSLELVGGNRTVYAYGQTAGGGALHHLNITAPERRHYPRHVGSVPVVANVAARDDLGGAIVFGGQTASDPASAFDIGRVFGLFDWRGNGTAVQGDWRNFYVDVPDDAPLGDGTQFLAHTVWPEAPTDIDLVVLGPSERRGPGNVGPDLFGPYDLAVMARSESTGHPADGRTGYAYSFRTATGGPEEWLAGPLRAGLHLFGHQNVLYGGTAPGGAPFTTTLGSVVVDPPEIALTTTDVTGTVEVRVTPSLDLPGLEVLAYGLQPMAVYSDVVGAAAQPGDLTDPAGNKTYPLPLAGSGLVDIQLGPSAAVHGYDLDLYLQRRDGTGQFRTVASSAGPTAVEAIRVLRPADGEYQVLVHGFTVPPGASYTLTILNAEGDDLQVTETGSGPVAGGSTRRLIVSYTLGAATGTGHGVLFVGPPGAPTVIEVPVTITRDGGRLLLPLVTRRAWPGNEQDPPIVSSMSSTLPASAQPTEVITLTAAKDSTLYEHPTGARSNGLGQHLLVGHTNHGQARRALPAGQDLDRVSLARLRHHC